MKLHCIAIAILATAASALAQTSITGFGTGEFTYDGSSTTTSFSQTGSNVFVSMSDAGGQLAGFFGTTSSITSGASLLLTATVSTNPGSAFTLDLFDGAQFQTYDGNWLSFTTNVATTATLTFGTPTPGFDFTNITGMALRTSGTPVNSVSVTLDQLSAVPEPSTYAAIFGVVCLGVAILRKKKQRAAAPAV